MYVWGEVFAAKSPASPHMKGGSLVTGQNMSKLIDFSGFIGLAGWTLQAVRSSARWWWNNC